LNIRDKDGNYDKLQDGENTKYEVKYRDGNFSIFIFDTELVWGNISELENKCKIVGNINKDVYHGH